MAARARKENKILSTDTRLLGASFFNRLDGKTKNSRYVYFTSRYCRLKYNKLRHLGETIELQPEMPNEEKKHEKL